jgi:hypothetical protein
MASQHTPIDTAGALASWRTMNKALSGCNEDQCLSLLNAEKAGQRRQPFMARIYGRYSMLRATRERAELAKA